MWWFCGLYCGKPSSNYALALVSHTNEQVTFSNIPEVAKTRLQLQGELAKSGGQKVYKNAIDVLAKTWRNEGIRGLQRGLGPAVSSPCTFMVSSSYFPVCIPGKHLNLFCLSGPVTPSQILLNGSRLGIYCLPRLLAKLK